MSYPRKNRLQIIGLIDAIYELRSMSILIITAKDLLSGDCSIPLSKEEYLERGLYLLHLYETELKTVLGEIEDIYEELQEWNK